MTGFIRRLRPVRCAGAVVLALGITVLAGAQPSSAGAPPDTAVCSAGGRFLDALNCWARAADRDSDGATVVRLAGPEALASGDNVTPLHPYLPALTKQLTVIVPSGTRTGSGGTFLLALAGHRLVATDSVITGLSAADQNRLTVLGVCPASSFCRPAARHDRPGRDLIAQKTARDVATSFFTVGSKPVRPPSAGPTSRTAAHSDGNARDDGSGDGPLKIVIGVLGALVLVLAVLTWLSRARTPRQDRSHARRHPFAPEPAASSTPSASSAAERDNPPPAETERLPAVPTPGPQQPAAHPRAAAAVAVSDRRRGAAVVRSVLGPQGYVEIDDLLFRARWDGPGAPPAVGRTVQVMRTETGLSIVPGLPGDHHNGPEAFEERHGQ